MKILSELIKKLNIAPVHGVMVGLHGFMFCETDEFPMDDTSDVIVVAKEVKKRYGGRAYGFRRCYYKSGEPHFIDKGWMFLQGTIRTAEQILACDDASESILRSNVKINGIKAVITTGGQTLPFDPVRDMLIRAAKGGAE